MKILKCIIEIFIALLLIILLSPIMILISLAIKLTSKGSILFIQERLGKDGYIFKIYKFRTMVKNAENISTGIYTNKNDKRITKIGNLLRKTSLDELPQLINILKGEMSFVGPRPPLPYHPYKYENYTDEQKLRFTVLPGITGYSQIKVRNKASWDERIKLDIEYVKKYSFLLDFKIIIMTVYVVTKRKNIYSNKKCHEKQDKS